MARLRRGDEGDASTWQEMREEAPFSSSYSAGDDGQLPYDVPLPMGLIQDHPEPLLIDRRLIQGGGSTHQAAGKNSQHSTGADENGCGGATRAGDGCASEDSSDDMPVCNAEPMTQEEAEAFDKGSMGSCFLEFGAFGMSQMSREQPAEASLRTAASQNAAEALQRFQAKGVLPRPSMEENRQMPASGSTDGDPSSNRSSFDTVPAAASSRLQGTTGWFDGISARDAAIARPAQVRLNSFDAQQLHGRNQQATARPTDAPSSSRAAHKALCVGLPAGRPRLALTQQEIIETNLQQMQTQQGGRDQAQQQQQQQLQRRGTTPVLQQSHMQLSLGMGLGLTLDLGSWHYGMSTGDDAAASQSGSAVTPRASAATHRRRAGAAVEEDPAEQVHKEQQPPAQQPPSWPMSMGVAAVSLQNVHSNHLGTALTAADILPSPQKAQAAQEAAHAGFPQNFAGAVKQEGPQGGNTGPVPGPRPFDDVHGAAAEFSRRNTARAPCKHGGQELSVRHESLERYRDKKRRRMFSSVKTIRYEKRKVNADRRPRLKGRFVKQMDFDNALEMIDEHSQLQPVPDGVMEHASDADCSGDEDELPAQAMHEEDDADAHLV